VRCGRNAHARRRADCSSDDRPDEHTAAARALVDDRVAFLESAAASDDLSADIDVLKKANFEWMANAVSLAESHQVVVKAVYDAWLVLCEAAQAAEVARYDAVVALGVAAGLAADAVNPAGDANFQALEFERILITERAKAARPSDFLRVDLSWNARLAESLLRELPPQDFLSEFV
jgi:hypothetical protein